MCNECNAQYKRLWRKSKYGSRPRIDDIIIRSVSIHNEAILDLVLSSKTMELCAFDVVSLKEFKVIYGPSETFSIHSIAIFAMDGSALIEWGLNGVANIKDHIANYLKSHGLRLELSPADILNSKQTIYYIQG